MKNICKQMSRRAWLAVVMMMLMTFPALAQKITVTGTVYEPDGEPAIGVSVMVKGQPGVGVTTNYDGEYTIQVEPNATLVASYVGYETQEVAVDGRTHIDITFASQSKALEEVVVIGYGTVKKEDATGSVSVIKPDEIEAGIAKSAQDMLVGASPGVTVTTNGGNPTGSATIRIRGGSSISANNNPLIVIDGVPQTDGDIINGTGVSALTMVNPNDIESMTILKDASATAIYGSRASNGVIIITTKKGASGKPKVNFAANWHYAKARKTLDVYDGDAYRKLANELFPGNANLGELGTLNTDWQDEVLRGAFSQDYNLSVSGTYKNLPYRVSASWADNRGIIKENGMQRTTVGINLSPKFFDKHLSVNVNLSGTYIDLKGYGNEGAVSSAISYNPTISPYKNYNMSGSSVATLYNGFYYWMQDGIANSEGQGKTNPLATIYDYNKKGKTLSSTGNIQLDYSFHFLPELHANLNLGYEVSKSDQETENLANGRGQWLNTSLSSMDSYGAGTQYKWHQLNRNTLLDFYLNYKKEVESIKSNFDVMVGYSWQRFSYLGHENTWITTKGFQTNSGAIPYENGVYNLVWDESSASNIGKEVTNAFSRWSAPNQLISFFGRFNYSFKDTYLLTFTLRDDGSSRFAKDNRWGLFPSVALGWRIVQNDFFKDVRSWWNDFKLRAGWGETGQQDVGSAFPYLATYTFSTGAFMYPDPVTGEWTYPLYPNGYDESLKWETTTTWNVGVDLAFLNNRITANFDWYLRKTKDLLYTANIAGTGTAASITRNIGNLENKGIEITVTARPIVTKDFTWTTGINWSYNKSKITSLTGDAASDSQPAAGLPVGTGGYIQYFTVDQEPYAFRVMEQVYDNNGDPIPGVYVDQNGDGTIDDSDFIYYHSRAPKHTLSWNNSFVYKDWDLSFVLRANLGNYVYNGPKASYGYTAQMTQYGWNNVLADTYLYGDLASDGYHYYSSYYVENASFLRCDNISLGYNFSSLLKNKLNLRLFAVVENPFVITKYKGIDPEVFSGIDSSVYPNPTTFTVGLTLNL
ncbi:MAG: TonB-dependent receptor [Bacteroidales bacterium]|nr:TonB-dependent receptor [Bacteroidales bacterium]